MEQTTKCKNTLENLNYDIFLKDLNLIMLGIKKFIRLFHSEILPKIERLDTYYEQSQRIETKELTYYYHSYRSNDFPMIELFNHRKIDTMGWADTKITREILSEIFTEQNLLPLDLSVIGGTAEFKDYFKFHAIDYIAPLISDEINERLKEMIPKNIHLFSSLSSNTKQIAEYIYAAWEINAITPHGYKSNSPYRSQLFKHKQYFIDLALKKINSQNEIKYSYYASVGYFDVLGRQVSFHEMPYEFGGVDYRKITQWVGIRTLCNPLSLSEQQYDTLKLMAFINEFRNDIIVPASITEYYTGQTIPNASSILELIYKIIKGKNLDIHKFRFFEKDKSTVRNYEANARFLYSQSRSCSDYITVTMWIIAEINNGEKSPKIIYNKVINNFDYLIKKYTSLASRSKKSESIVKYETLIADTKENKQIFIEAEPNSIGQIAKMVEYKYEYENYEKVKESIITLLREKIQSMDIMNFGGAIISNKHTSLGSSKQLGITPKVAGHDMIAICDCGAKFSYENSKKDILWECPECKRRNKIVE